MSAIAIRSRRVAAVGLVLASVGAAAVPSLAVAAPQQPITVKYAVRVAGGDLIHTSAKVTNPEPSVKRLWSRNTIGKVVRKGVNNGYKTPYWAQGYHCKPVMDGNVAHYTCKLRGGDVPTQVILRFAARV